MGSRVQYIKHTHIYIYMHRSMYIYIYAWMGGVGCRVEGVGFYSSHQLLHT